MVAKTHKSRKLFKFYQGSKLVQTSTCLVRQLAKNSTSPSLNITCPSNEIFFAKENKYYASTVIKSCIQLAKCSAHHHHTSTQTLSSPLHAHGCAAGVLVR